MRITQAQREATEQRIVESARKLLCKKGFHATTTRDLASAAGIASGTFFNYFDTKEALVVSLVSAALDEGHEIFNKERRPEASLEEHLFAFIATGLRSLKPHRSYMGRALEPLLGALSPIARGGAEPRIQTRQLQAICAILESHGMPEVDAVTLHLLWSLYLGVLSFFAADDSPNQEDTLALADRTVDVWVSLLKPPARAGGVE